MSFCSRFVRSPPPRPAVRTDRVEDRLLMRLQYASPNPSFINSIPTLVNFSEKDDMKIFSVGDSVVASTTEKDAKGAAASVGGTVGKGLSPTDILWRVKCDFAQVCSFSYLLRHPVLSVFDEVRHREVWRES